MLQPMGLQRAGHDLVPEKEQPTRYATYSQHGCVFQSYV